MHIDIIGRGFKTLMVNGKKVGQDNYHDIIFSGKCIYGTLGASRTLLVDKKGNICAPKESRDELEKKAELVKLAEMNDYYTDLE